MFVCLFFFFLRNGFANAGRCILHESLRRGSNMNNEFMLESPQDKVYTQQSPLDIQIVPISKKLNRDTNFTTDGVINI